MKTFFLTQQMIIENIPKVKILKEKDKLIKGPTVII